MLEIALASCPMDLAQKISFAIPKVVSSVKSFKSLSELSCAGDKFDLIIIHHSHSEWDDAICNSFERYLPKNTPAIALIPADQPECSVSLLNAGVDRCLPVSFDANHFSAVVRALTRRSHGLITSVSQYGALIFNHETKQTWILDEEVDLTQREVQVLEILLKRVGQIIAKKDFICEMTPDSTVLNEGAVEVYVHRLRKKINGELLPIRNIKRCGYFLRRFDLPLEITSQLNHQFRS